MHQLDQVEEQLALSKIVFKEIRSLATTREKSSLSHVLITMHVINYLSLPVAKPNVEDKAGTLHINIADDINSEKQLANI